MFRQLAAAFISWLVISAREPWVMQPSRTSFFNKQSCSVNQWMAGFFTPNLALSAIEKGLLKHPPTHWTKLQNCSSSYGLLECHCSSDNLTIPQCSYTAIQLHTCTQEWLIHSVVTAWWLANVPLIHVCDASIQVVCTELYVPMAILLQAYKW